LDSLVKNPKRDLTCAAWKLIMDDILEMNETTKGSSWYQFIDVIVGYTQNAISASVVD
jgi:hypothetical protein